MEIVAVGAGALGSWTLDLLAKRLKALSLPIPIRVIDFDEVDHRNYANQFFTLGHKGQSKAEVIVERIKGYDIAATAVKEKIDEHNIEDLIKPSETRLLLNMVDNAHARTLLWMMSVKHDIACMHSGVSKAGHGTVIWTAKGYDHWFNMGIKGRLQGNAKQNAEAANDEKLPPCELLEFGSLCIQTSMAAAKAVTMYFGRDPEKNFGGEVPPDGTMVCFKTLPDFHQVDNHKGVKVHGQEDDERDEAGEDPKKVGEKSQPVKEEPAEIES